MKAIAIIKYVFSLFGIAMLAGGLFAYQHTRSFLATAARAEGTVVEVIHQRSSDSSTYKPVVQFATADGRQVEFTSSVGSNPPAYSKGAKVEVLYQPSSPEQARINGFLDLWLLPAILGGMGAVFTLIGVVVFFVGPMSRRKIERLKAHGRRIEADFQGVELNKSLSVNDRSPYRVLAQWQNPATSAVHVFQSENLWFDPTKFITQKRLTVFIDGDNPKRYHVDLSFLPKGVD
jgi:hypothetical protein